MSIGLQAYSQADIHYTDGLMYVLTEYDSRMVFAV